MPSELQVLALYGPLMFFVVAIFLGATGGWADLQKVGGALSY
jgi:hypothetical protein